MAKKKAKKKDDLLVAGVGSPISLKKVLKKIPGKRQKPLTLLLNQTGQGLALDEPTVIYIKVTDRTEQAQHFLTMFKELTKKERNIPAYLFRYLHYLFIDGSDFPYKTDADFRKAITDKIIDVDKDTDFCRIFNLIYYCDTNPEAAQAIGFIQLIAGLLKEATKRNTGFRAFIEEPETHMHPKRQRLIISVLNKLREEYGHNISNLKNNIT